MNVSYKDDIDFGPHVDHIFYGELATEKHLSSIKKFVFDKVLGRQFQISQCHIFHGTKCHSLGCPLALSLLDNFDTSTISVGLYTADIHFTREDMSIMFIFALSPEISEWICDFDTGKNVAPIDVEIQLINDEFTLVPSQ